MVQIATVSKWLEQLTLSDIGSIASLVGLALTIWVAMAVRRIKARFMITARVPDLAKSLRQHATKLSGFLSDPKDRQFWVEVEHPELGRSFIYPGGAAIYSKTPWRISRRAPLLGEHNEEVLRGELGLAPEELSLLGERGVV